MDTFILPDTWIDRRISVALIGVGGTGSEMIDELYRIHSLITMLGGDGISVTAYDPDKVSRANIGRQRFWPSDVGLFKAEILVNRLNSFGGVRWRYVNSVFDCELVSNYDLIITCVDTPIARAQIGKSGKSAEMAKDVLWLDCGNDHNSGNVILGHYSHQNEQRLPNVFDLYPVLATMASDRTDSCSTEEALTKQDYGINRSIAREGANLIWQLLRHGVLSHHGSYIEIGEGRVTPLPIDDKGWEMYGYSC